MPANFLKIASDEPLFRNRYVSWIGCQQIALPNVKLPETVLRHDFLNGRCLGKIGVFNPNGSHHTRMIRKSRVVLFPRRPSKGR